MDEKINPIGNRVTYCSDLLAAYWEKSLVGLNASIENSLNGTSIVDHQLLDILNRSSDGNWLPSAMVPGGTILPPGRTHSRMSSSLSGASTLLFNQQQQDGDSEEMRRLKYYSYGIALPAICVLGIIGNVLNLVVLTRPTMRGPAYVYMRGYAGAALLAIVFALPFSSRILFHNEVGPWTSFAQAFFHTHLELFLGNACLGIGVFMLVALTVERYTAVCRLGRTRAFAAHKTPLVASALALLAVSLYLPYLFRAHVVTCHSSPPNTLDVEPPSNNHVDRITDKELLLSSSHAVYQKRENPLFAHSTMWAVYLWTLEVIFKMLPTLVIVHLNCCIIVAYRRTCARRRQMANVNNKTAPPTPIPAGESPIPNNTHRSQHLVVPSASDSNVEKKLACNSFKANSGSSPCPENPEIGDVIIESSQRLELSLPSAVNVAVAGGSSSVLLTTPGLVVKIEETILGQNNLTNSNNVSNSSNHNQQSCYCTNSYHDERSISQPARSNGSQNPSPRPNQSSEDSRRFWEEKRLMFLLGSTSILFSVCIIPQLVLSLMIHEAVLESYSFQVFRAVANILEVTNYSFTFYIYCFFSRDFRATLFQTFRLSKKSTNTLCINSRLPVGSKPSRRMGPREKCLQKCSIPLNIAGSPTAHEV